MNHFVEVLTLTLTCLIVHQKQIQKIFRMLILQVFYFYISHLAGLKTEVDKLDIGKLVPVPVNLSKLSDVVKK